MTSLSSVNKVHFNIFANISSGNIGEYINIYIFHPSIRPALFRLKKLVDNLFRKDCKFDNISRATGSQFENDHVIKSRHCLPIRHNRSLNFQVHAVETTENQTFKLYSRSFSHKTGPVGNMFGFYSFRLRLPNASAKQLFLSNNTALLRSVTLIMILIQKYK